VTIKKGDYFWTSLLETAHHEKIMLCEMTFSEHSGHECFCAKADLLAFETTFYEERSESGNSDSSQGGSLSSERERTNTRSMPREGTPRGAKPLFVVAGLAKCFYPRSPFLSLNSLHASHRVDISHL
jgi:hypothetical protein